MAKSLNLQGLTFLIADENQNFRRIAVRILRDFGAGNIIQCQDGREVLAALERTPVDMLLCDAFLPELNGFDVTKKIRLEDNQFRYLPVVILTSHSQKGNVERARDAGASLVMAKPISPSSLYKHLLWAAKNDRAFVESPVYVGPDRRFKIEGFPSGVGRRKDDQIGEVGAAKSPQMSQDEIDSLLK